MIRGLSRNGKECKANTIQIDVENVPPVKKVKPVINAEDIKTFFNEFSKESEYVYFGDTNGWLAELIVSVSKMSEAYLESAQAFMMVLYAEEVNAIKLLTFFWQKAPS